MKELFGTLNVVLWFILVVAISFALVLVAILFAFGRAVNIKISIPKFEFPRIKIS